MEGWKKYRLGDVLCEKGYIRGPFGSALKRGDLLDEGIPVYEQQHAIYNRRDFRFYINEEKYNEMKRFTVYPEDIIISCSGTVGEVSLINKEDPLGIISQALLLLRANISIILPEYLLYFFKTAKGHNSITSRSSGSVQVNIAKREVIESIPLYIPNIEIQSRIVNILRSLDDKIAVNKKICENLEAQAQALFKSWFVDFEPFKGGEFVESELGMIPKGWRVGCLDELCSFISRGITPKYDEKTNEFILGQTCVRNNIVTLNNAKKHLPKKKNEKWVRQWDVLINSTGVGSLGRVGVVYFEMDNVAIDSHITVVRAKSALLHHYLGRNLLSRQLEIENMAVGSTGQTELPKDRVRALSIIVPDDNTLDNFNAIIEPMALSMYRNLEENKRLASLRDTLLPRLMSGELKVDEIEKENLSNSTRL